MYLSTYIAYSGSEDDRDIELAAATATSNEEDEEEKGEDWEEGGRANKVAVFLHCIHREDKQMFR